MSRDTDRPAQTEKARRQAEALRANLARRKAQSRARAEQGEEAPAPAEGAAAASNNSG